jgi:tetratricopeptide (TPR) repeat protein
MRGPVLALGLAVAASLASVASAQSAKQMEADEQARAVFEVGVQAYATGDYESAIQAFEEARRRSDRPGLLFSIAQAHRRAYQTAGGRAHLEAAIEHFQRYLTRVPRGGRSADAERALAGLEPARLGAREGAKGDSEAGRLGRLMISSPTSGATLFVDGEPAPRLPFVAPVAPGVHKLAVKAEGFVSDERTVEAPPGQVVAFNVELKELPATILLGGTTGGEVLLDGQPVGFIPMQPLKTRAGWHRVILRKDGYQIASQDVLARRGSSESLNLRLVTTGRRDVAWTLMGASAVALGAGAGLGVYALTEQNRARAILDRQGAQGITRSEYDGYLAARSHRDTAATAGVVAGATGLALGLAGLALYLLDAPGPLPPTPHWTEPSPARPVQPADLAFGAPPGWSPSLASFDLRVAF